MIQAFLNCEENIVPNFILDYCTHKRLTFSYLYNN
jgi:hypothetical protein